jgi:hypothetical protein
MAWTLVHLYLAGPPGDAGGTDMRILDGLALVLAVLLSLLLVSTAAVYTRTDAGIVPVPVVSGERRAADSPPAAPPDEIRGKTLAWLLLMLKDGRGIR